MNDMYRCTNDWFLDGKLICKEGKMYRIVDAGGDDEGYCDVLGCEDGNITWSNWVDVSEYFEV